jgi:cell division protease FtsH
LRRRAFGRRKPRGTPGAASTRRYRQLIDTAHLDVTAALTEHRERLDTLAQALLKTETLDELDAYAAAQMPPRTAAAGATVAVAHMLTRSRRPPTRE